jgi:hypothetical protein
LKRFGMLSPRHKKRSNSLHNTLVGGVIPHTSPTAIAAYKRAKCSIIEYVQSLRK